MFEQIYFEPSQKTKHLIIELKCETGAGKKFLRIKILTPLSTFRNKPLFLMTINTIFISIVLIIIIIIIICLDNHLLSRARVLGSPIIPHLVQLRVERLH